MQIDNHLSQNITIMTYLKHLLRTYPVACFYILIIWVLCFATIPETPLDNVRLIDKWVHSAMYLGTCLTIWIEYLRKHSVEKTSLKRLLALAWIAPILMSGLIEILQANCTGGRRSGEWLDFAANSIGATLAAAIGVIILHYRKRR